MTIGAKPVGESAACFSFSDLQTLTIPAGFRHGDQSAMLNPTQELFLLGGGFPDNNAAL